MVLTAHAAQRLISRGITGDELRAALTDPQVCLFQNGLEVRRHGDVKVILDGTRIVTVARREKL